MASFLKLRTDKWLDVKRRQLLPTGLMGTKKTVLVTIVLTNEGGWGEMIRKGHTYPSD